MDDLVKSRSPDWSLAERLKWRHRQCLLTIESMIEFIHLTASIRGFANQDDYENFQSAVARWTSESSACFGGANYAATWADDPELTDSIQTANADHLRTRITRAGGHVDLCDVTAFDEVRSVALAIMFQYAALAALHNNPELSEMWDVVDSCEDAISRLSELELLQLKGQVQIEHHRTLKYLAEDFVLRHASVSEPSIKTDESDHQSLPGPDSDRQNEQIPAEDRAVAILYSHFRTSRKLMKMDDLETATGISRSKLYTIEAVKTARSAIKKQMADSRLAKGFKTTEGDVDAIYEDPESSLY